MRYFPIALTVGVVFAAWQFFGDRPVGREPGVLVDSIPSQRLLEDAHPIEFKGVVLKPRAEFSAEVRVLGRERYRVGELAEVAPLDIAVGWGEMSDSSVLQDIDISQRGRFYHWQYDDRPPIPEIHIISQSANWHLIPANALVWRSLRDLRVGDLVTLEGTLVDIESAEEGVMKTSLRRDDSGAGACEILLVDEAEIGRR
jgi:hypothetical protein